MIENSVQDDHYPIRAPKGTLVMTKAEFIQALKRGKTWRQRQTPQAGLAQALQET